MILSIDTFSDTLGISLLDNEKLIYRESVYRAKPFSELIVDRLDRAFKYFSFKKENLEKIVVNKGPGSFTSLRVGITVAKSISYALNIKIYTYISLDAMAFKYRFFTGKIISVINAGKGELYRREYISDGLSIEPVSEISLVKQSIFLPEEESLVISKNVSLNHKRTVYLVEDLSLEGAFLALKNNQTDDVMHLEPLYIRGL